MNPFKNKKVLIAGGLGFIGSNLARKLVDLGAAVQIVDSLVPESGGNLFNISGIEHKIDVHIADVRQEFELQPLVLGQDYLFNLIGQTGHLDSMKDPQTDLELNCRAQLSILEACRKLSAPPKIIFTSTRQIYGKPHVLPVNEQHALNPIDINGVHKLTAEWYHKIYGDVYGLRCCILRLTNTYGPRMRIQDSRQTFFGNWIHEILTGSEFEIFGDGNQLRDFTYIDDVVDALLLAAERPEADRQIFNVGAEPVSLKELAAALVGLNGSGSYRLVPFPEHLRTIDIGNYYADTVKIRFLFGWSPKINLNDGLSRTLEFFRQNLRHYRNEQKVNATL